MTRAVKLLIVANVTWTSWDEKIARLKTLFPGYFTVIDVLPTSFTHIPFRPITSDKGEQGYGVDLSWYDANISPLGRGYDITLFVVSHETWGVGNPTRGWRADRTFGPVELQIGADEHEAIYQGTTLLHNTFDHYARHEITHALYLIAGVRDRTHYWDYERKNLAGALDDLATVPDPHEAEKVSVLSRLLERLQALLALITSQPPMPHRDLIAEFCLAIQSFEGWYDGSRSKRNNNPGNLRFASQRGAIGKDRAGFARFADYETGFAALRRQVEMACTGKSRVYSPQNTIEQFFHIYAPASDGNAPKKYAAFVAGKLGVAPTTKMRDLL